MTSRVLLEARGVWKSFDEHAVLRGLDLDVHLHQAVVLIGASGSGKSTLLRCINGLETVDAGSITLDGDVTVTDPNVDLDKVRRRVGIVFQSYNLFPHMTVIDNVTLSPRKVAKVPMAQAREEAMELLARLGLAAKANEYPDRLSGGQAQRVAIARALAMRPELMLFDEITSALDHRDGDSRDGIRPRGRRPRVLPARGNRARAGPSRAGVHRSAARPDA